jgi:hypothetical protein
MLYPAIIASPADDSYSPVSIEIKVVFPAPFGPSNPNIVFFSILRVTSLTASFGPVNYTV